MKRDIDLCRQLLLDIEARGADCSVSVLRTDANHDAEERVRYHLRLLVDAGYLKEVDRTTSGVPCLRLSDAGHELIELTRSEGRWREAKWACQERTGGLALAVIRGILLDWAWTTRPRTRRRYAPTSADSLFVSRPRRRYVATEPAAPVDELAWADDAAVWTERCEHAADARYVDDARYVRVRPHRNGWRKSYVPATGLRGEAIYDASLPEYLI
jgi:hypothetical protein